MRFEHCSPPLFETSDRFPRLTIEYLLSTDPGSFLRLDPFITAVWEQLPALLIVLEICLEDRNQPPPTLLGFHGN
jgi:hypothetical protein